MCLSCSNIASSHVSLLQQYSFLTCILPPTTELPHCVLPPATERLPLDGFSADAIVGIFTDFFCTVLRSKKFVVLIMISFGRSAVCCTRHLYRLTRALRRVQLDVQLGTNGTELIQGHILPVENVTIHLSCFLLRTGQKTLADSMALSTYFCR